MVSNTKDLTRFAQGLFGGELLQPDSLSQMLAFVNNPEGGRYGLGVASLEIPGLGTVLGYSGGTVRYASNMWYFPDLGVTYADLQNSQPSSNIIYPMLTTLAQHQGGNPKPVPEPSVLAGLMVIGAGFWLKRQRRTDAINTNI